MHTFKNHMMKKVWKKRIQIQVMNVFVICWGWGEVEHNFVSFPYAPQNFPGWVLYRGLFEVGLIFSLLHEVHSHGLVVKCRHSSLQNPTRPRAKQRKMHNRGF